MISRLSWLLLAAMVLVQICFPLTSGGTRALTTAAVIAFAAAMLLDAAATRGAVAALLLLVIAGGGGLIAEAVGIRTGFPFGSYHYTGTLGLEVLGVPLLVPLAWVMMAWPAWNVARRLVGRHGRAATVVVGAYALTAWDVFLDPQMVDAGHWQWERTTPALPGVEGIPLSNFGGWLLVSLVMMMVLDAALALTARTTTPGDSVPVTLHVDAVPVTAYLWTYFSSVLAHAVFFGRPPVALTGALLMGVVAIPLAVSVIREIRTERRTREQDVEVA